MYVFSIGVDPLPMRDDLSPWRGQRADGYGSRIRTSYTVEWAGRWRRVYVCQYGATGAYYVNVKGQRIGLAWGRA